MTQQEQQDFMERLEEALSWMKAVQEKLRTNDNTEGPWDALESRLRETEKIHHSMHEGQVKMDMAQVAAEHLLEMGDEELRTNTQAKLKDLKSNWEETCTYTIHCHSRIEWVWLHWSEYLKAYEEFMLWLMKQQCSLDVTLEQQLGLKEKLWQVDQQRVMVSDIRGQAALLERLLDEAAALHNRIQDPCVDPQTQERLQGAYNDVSTKAEERLSLLQKIAEEHQTYQGCVQRFQSWLLSKTKELTDLMEKEDTTENKLQALRAVDESVASEEKTLQHIEGVSEAVRVNSSPAGAEVVVEEAEELRLGWQRLRQGLCEAEDGLRSSLDARCDYTARRQRLGVDVGGLRVRLQGLDQDLEKVADVGDEEDLTEELMVRRWRKYTDVRNGVAMEETQVEHLKSQLKDLFRFSEDSRHISDDVLAVVKEHQSVKCKAARLCSESECLLRNALQDPLMSFGQWRQAVSEVLETSAVVTDFSHIVMLLEEIERLLKDSFQLQDVFKGLKTRGDLLVSVFGPERCAALQSELTASMKNRELLHGELLQRQARLQASVSRTKDFGDAYILIGSKLRGLRDRMMAAEVLQPDILAKKSQFDQLKAIQKDLEDCEAHITFLETLISSSSSNRAQFEKVHADWKQLCNTIRVKLHESEQSIEDHKSFHESLLNMEKCLMVLKQKVESFRSPTGEWNIDGRKHEAEKALGEFPEKELQLQQMEVQCQKVLQRTSQKGGVHIVEDMNRLKKSWLNLYEMSGNIHRLLNGSTEQMTVSDMWGINTLGPTEMAEVVDGGHHPKGHLIPPRQEELPKEVASMTNEERSDQSRGAFVHLRQKDGAMVSRDQYKSKRKQFEAWLSRENQLLSGILSTKRGTLTSNQVQKQRDTLKALKAGVSWGQDQFQLLLQDRKESQAGSGPAEDASFEELRYRWILYKSKLKDARVLQKRLNSKKPSLMQRVCRLALPLWLFFLALLLIAFLLPLMDKDHSCSLSNNFARSFNMMLRYSGPPPT
ncbi:nesprin-3 [Entelurus aequoreus]|uniref:nesprin-3 n=1 Tax=Entelurus aequoreus TaxID=161455 RepID=UPI002B1D3748|nr:nesprin-3 [Entelurus aequoreus]